MRLGLCNHGRQRRKRRLLACKNRLAGQSAVEQDLPWTMKRHYVLVSYNNRRRRLHPGWQHKPELWRCKRRGQPHLASENRRRRQPKMEPDIRGTRKHRSTGQHNPDPRRRIRHSLRHLPKRQRSLAVSSIPFQVGLFESAFANLDDTLHNHLCSCRCSGSCNARGCSCLKAETQTLKMQLLPKSKVIIIVALFLFYFSINL
jgi:hypothetical protein